MKTFFMVAAAFAIIASPASAQLLGGGGALGGGLGGALGSPMSSIGSATRGTFDSAASTSGSQSVDRRSGRVRADRSASGSIGGTLESATDLPRRSLAGSANGSASGSASGNADAQLIGTDSVRGVTSRAAGTARDALDRTRERAGNAAAMANGVNGMTNGMADGMASGNGSDSFSGALGQLALSGTSAASDAGSFDVAPGMDVVNRSGRAIGSVRSVATDSSGRVRSVLVAVGNRTASIPAANFTGSGSALVSAMGKGELKDAAKDQRDAEPAETNDTK